jgi:hypothetical protein
MQATAAAAVSTPACHLRLAHWQNRPDSLWLLEALLFFCSIVLWSFVFAWHTEYTRRPVFAPRLEPRVFAIVTVTGIAAGAVFHILIDPALRTRMPEDYPADLEQWFALLLFSMAFNQLFFIFAPFAWLVRLFQNEKAAAGLTVLFGAAVLAVKLHSTPVPMSTALFAALLAGRVVMGCLSVSFYLRGGMLLSWWWTLLVESRHLANLL